MFQISSFKNRYSFDQLFQFGMLILTILLLLSFVFTLIAGRSDNGESNQASRIALIISQLFSIAVLFVLLTLFNRKRISSFKHLLKSGTSLAHHDLGNLLTVTTGIGQGDFKNVPKIAASTIAEDENNEFNPVVKLMNQIIHQVHDMADELNNMTGTPCLRLCFVGADSFLEGRKCGENMGELVGGRGQIIIVVGNMTHIGHTLRRKGFETSIRENYSEIEIVEIFESGRSPEAVYKAMQNFVKTHDNITGVYCTDTESILGVVKFKKENPDYSSIKTVAHDIAKTTAPHIQKGEIDAALNQNPIAQGHDPVIMLYNHLTAGWQPPTPRMLLDMGIINQHNVDSVWGDGQGVILTSDIQQSLQKPIPGRSEKQLRIAVLGREENTFWTPAKMGAQLAASTLESFNVDVKWICPEENLKDGETSAKVYGPAIDRLLEERWDGIAVVASDPELVSYINKAVREGIPVITWNSEPANLGSLVFTIKDQSDKLLSLSATLASSTYENSQATTRIKEAMNNMALNAVTQNREVSSTHEIITSLLDHISVVDSETGRSTDAAEETVKSVDDSTRTLVNTLESIKEVGVSIAETGEIVRDLHDYSQEIDRVVDVINDIASRVNVLALNARIEATKAGKAGAGFNVVANEVRKLSGNTREAVQEVTDMIDSFQSTIQKVEKTMRLNVKAVEKTTSDTEISRTSIQSIRDRVETDKNRLQRISAMVREMRDFSHKVDVAIQKLADISQTGAQTVEEVNVSTEEMSTQLADVSDMARVLQSMAQGELDLLAKFQLKSE